MASIWCTLALGSKSQTAKPAVHVQDIIVVQMPPLYVAPVVPGAFSGMARDIVTQLDAAMAAAVQEAQARYDQAGEGSPLYGTKLHVLLDTPWMEEAMSEVQPPFTDTKGGPGLALISLKLLRHASKFLHRPLVHHKVEPVACGMRQRG